MRLPSWLHTLPSLNRLPPSPPAKQHIKSPSYLFVFHQNCLCFASPLVSLRSLFKRRITHLSHCYDINHKTQKALAAQNVPCMHCIHHLQALSTAQGQICAQDAFFLPGYPHPSPRPETLHAFQSLRAVLGAGCGPPFARNETLFCSLFITVHLAGCLFPRSAYSAKTCSLERFQLSSSRKWS